MGKVHQKYYFLLIFILSLFNLQSVLSVPTLPQGIHTVHVGQFQSDTSSQSEKVISYYDYNQDQYCDVLSIVTRFSVQNKKLTYQFLTLYLWNQKQQMFQKSTEINLGAMNVKAIISTQLYHRTTHETDLILVYDYVGTDKIQQSQERYSIHFMKIVHNPSAEVCSITASFSPIAAVKNIDGVTPTVIILNGKISIIYRKNKETFVLYFLIQPTGEVSYEVESLVRSKKYISNDQQQIGLLAYELGYFGDYNGDGIADLVIAQKYSQSQNKIKQNTRIHFFKYNKQQTKFSLEKTFDLKVTEEQLSTPMQFFTLHDINFDGKIDLIILFKSGLIQIHYNNQPASTQLVAQNGFSTFPFDLFQLTESSTSKIQRLKITNYLPTESSTLLFGDFNLDGFDDLIVDYQYNISTGTFDHDGTEITKSAQKSLLLINTPCLSVSDCGDSNFNNKFLKTLDLFSIRKFIILNTLPTSYKTSESQKMFFIDLFKDGKLDIVSHKLSPTSFYFDTDNKKHQASQIDVYYNNEHYDAFFMKVRVMKGNDYNEIHNNLVIPGGNVNLYVTGLSGEMLPKVGNQYSQLGALMQLPYVFFGLGRTNNYVNQLTVTIPYVSQNLSYTYMWTPIVPNSQVLTLANPQGFWQLTAFIEPTQKMAMVSLLVVLALAILGFFICRLTIQQKNEDKENLQSFYTILR